MMTNQDALEIIAVSLSDTICNLRRVVSTTHAATEGRAQQACQQLGHVAKTPLPLRLCVHLRICLSISYGDILNELTIYTC